MVERAVGLNWVATLREAARRIKGALATHGLRGGAAHGINAAMVTKPVRHDMDLANEAATRALAARLAGALAPGDVIGLSGPLGAGKSVLARALIQTLAGAAIAVPSPTFTLVQAYDDLACPVWHVDLYRIEDRREIAELGLDEALDHAALVIEWPERLGAALPDDRLDIALAPVEGQSGARHAILTGHGQWGDRLEKLTA